MPVSQPANHIDPLDVLRRFVETPLQSAFCLGGVMVHVRTNDPDLLQAIPQISDSRPAPNLFSFHWKLIRDEEISSYLEEPLLLSLTTVSVIHFGSACFAAIDHDRHELYSFIGSAIDLPCFKECILPIFLKLTEQPGQTLNSPDANLVCAETSGHREE